MVHSFRMGGMLSTNMSLCAQAPNFKEAKSSEGNQDDTAEDSQSAPEGKRGDYSGLSSSSLAPLPQDVQNIKKAVEDSHIWGDIQDAVDSVKFRQEEEAEDAKERSAAAPIQQAKEVLRQASHRVLETASSVYHAVSDTASHLLHKDKSQNDSDPAGSSSSKSQTRDAHDGAVCVLSSHLVLHIVLLVDRCSLDF